MKKVYILSTIDSDALMADFGEAQFAFDENLNPIGWWSLDDADFREEYFSGMMGKLGIEVLVDHPKVSSLIRKEAKKYF